MTERRFGRPIASPGDPALRRKISTKRARASSSCAISTHSSGAWACAMSPGPQTTASIPAGTSSAASVQKSSPPVDVTKPYVERGSFLEIERAAREGRAHDSCGGRALNDDVMDTLFTLMINGGNGPVVRDGVDEATRPASRSFPYLAPANPDPPQQPEHHH